MYNLENILFVVALASEIHLGKLDGVKTLVTGVGKVNSAYAITKYLENDKKIKLVVNIGTAGGNKTLKTGDILQCNNFIQYDCHVKELNLEVGKVPFDETPSIIHADFKLKKIKTGDFVCASGDRFNTDNFEYDVYDMEAASLARICLNYKNVKFIAIKYITDTIKRNNELGNGSYWVAELPKAQNKLTDIILNFNKYL